MARTGEDSRGRLAARATSTTEGTLGPDAAQVPVAIGRSRGLRRIVPIVGWLPGYRRPWLRPDLLAGLTVTAILIPEGMAYAQLAGVSPKAAFYAAPVGLLLYAIFGTSRQLVVAVSSAVAITSAATITLLAPQGSSDYVALTAALALLAGILSVLAGVLRLGRIAQFFSSSVLVGFVFGLALIITMKQIPKLLGIDVHEQEFFAGLWRTVQHLGDTSVVTLVVGVAGVAGMVVMERLVPKLPAALVVLIGSIAASAALDLASHGVAVVGDLPSGLAAPKLPGVGLDAVPLLVTGAVGIALLVFAEATGPAQQFAREHDYGVAANQELVALGAANMGAGLFQGFSIGASLSKSAANDRVGARTPVSLLAASAATAIVALFFTPLFRDLPEAALAAIVIVAVSDMERIEPLLRLWRIRRADCVLALVALFGVLILEILPGLAVAVIASLGVLVWRAGEARLEFLGPTMSGLDVTSIEHAASPAIIVVRPDQMMFFVNANEIRDAMIGAVAECDPRPEVILFDLALTADLDVPAADAMSDLQQRLEAAGIQLWVAGLIPPVRARLQAAGLVETIGARHVFDDVAGALLAYLDMHSLRGIDVRREVISDLLEFADTRRHHPALDAVGRQTLDAVIARLQHDLDELATTGDESSAPRGSEG